MNYRHIKLYGRFSLVAGGFRPAEALECLQSQGHAADVAAAEKLLAQMQAAHLLEVVSSRGEGPCDLSKVRDFVAWELNTQW